MIRRFAAYSVLKNFRPADPFLFLYLIDLTGSFAMAGAILGFQHFITATVESPLGIVADRYGRRTSLAVSFLAYFFAFGLFPLATIMDGSRLPVLFAAAALFAMGEALRTGCQKAIMLDWLDQEGRGGEATEVIGYTRMFSKFSSGATAILGGIVLAVLGRFEPLFYASMVPALAGFFCVLSYPKSLEGEQRRSGAIEGSSPLDLFRQPGIGALTLQSVIFESQIKLLVRAWVQPFLSVITGGGAPAALSIGGHEFVRDSLGAVAARRAAWFERWAGGREAALRFAYRAGVAVMLFLIAVSFIPGVAIVGILAFILLTILQNARRPVFVSALNDVMQKPQRATTLSIESQARVVALAVLMPLTGLCADAWGIAAVFIVPAVLFVCGMFVRTR